MPNHPPPPRSTQKRGVRRVELELLMSFVYRYTQQRVIGIGSVHHVAFRTPTDAQQQVLRHKLVRAGLNATPVIDRFYFHSVYLRETWWCTFEIATNPPGFTVDEKAEELGTHLVLPPWLESIHRDLEILPAIIHPKKRAKTCSSGSSSSSTYGVTRSR